MVLDDGFGKLNIKTLEKQNLEALKNAVPDFSNKLNAICKDIMSFYGQLRILIESAEACDCTLKVQSYGQATKIKIQEHGWEPREKTFNQMLLHASIVDETQSANKHDLGEDISDNYSYPGQQRLNIIRESQRGVPLMQENLSLVIMLADFVNQAITQCIKSKKEVKVLSKEAIQKKILDRFGRQTVIKLPQGLESSKAYFTRPEFLENLSSYINERIAQKIINEKIATFG